MQGDDTGETRTLAEAGAGGQRALPSRFQILEVLGVGGMGTVYRARDSVLDREVAVKQLSLAATGPTHARLLREARAAGRLDHPGVVRIHDVLEDDLCIVMEHVHGTSLKTRLRAGPLPAPEVRRLARELLGALGAAHAAGIVHRDVKPANILLGASGATLTDFGIARVEGSELTTEGETMGTPAYMAPEQSLDPASVDARADLYAVAVVLYEAACGRHPRTPQGLDPDPLATVRAATGDSGLARAVAGALGTRPSERWRSAAEMASALDVRSRWRFVPLVAVVLATLSAALLALRGLPSGPRVAPEPTFEAAHASFRAGRSEEARGALERVVRLDPANGRAWFDLAVSRWWAGERFAVVDEAIARAFAIPLEARERLCLEALREVARYRDGDAVARLRAAPAAVRDTLEAQYLLGEALYHTGRPQEAMSHFHRALDLAPEFRLARVHAFRYYVAHRDVARADRLLEWSRRHEPDAMPTLEGEMQIACAQRNFDSALDWAERLVALPEHRTPDLVGRIHDLAGNTERARASLRACAGPPKRDAGCAWTLAMVEAGAGETDAFESLLRQVPPHVQEPIAEGLVLREATSMAIVHALLGRAAPARAELAAANALVQGGTDTSRSVELARLVVAFSAGRPLPPLTRGHSPDPVASRFHEGLEALRENRASEAAGRFAAARAMLEEASLVALLRSFEARSWAAAGDARKHAAACDEVVWPPLWSAYRAPDLRSCRRAVRAQSDR